MIAALLWFNACSESDPMHSQSVALSPYEVTIAPTWTPIPGEPGAFEVTFPHQGLERHLYVDIPTSYSTDIPAPVVFFFHGHGQSAQIFRGKHPRMRAEAAAKGCILVTPQGELRDDGKSAWTNYADPYPFFPQPYIDDRQFVEDFLSYLGTEYSVDLLRVFVCGFSNGARFTQYLMATRSYLYAAGVSCANSVAFDQGATGTPEGLVYIQTPEAPASLMMIFGGRDDRFLWNGGINSRGEYCLDYQGSIDFWVAANGCSPAPTTYESASGDVICRYYDGGSSGRDFVAVGVSWMKHEWADFEDAGPGDDPFDASVAAFLFFQSHGL